MLLAVLAGEVVVLRSQQFVSCEQVQAVVECQIALKENKWQFGYDFGWEVLGVWFNEHFLLIVEGRHFGFGGVDSNALGGLLLFCLPFGDETVDFRVEFRVDLDHEVHAEVEGSAHVPAVQAFHYFDTK